MQVGHGQGAGNASRTYHFDLGPKRGQRHSHVRGMGGDTLIAGTEDRRVAVQTLHRRAARAGHPLIAGLGRVVEIGATGTLHQVSTRRRLIANLARTARQDSLDQHRIGAAHLSVGGDVAVGDRATDAQTAVSAGRNLRKTQAMDIHQMGRHLDV